MKKKLNKGNPITELVKGSLEYTIRLIRDAFRAQFPEETYGFFELVDSFADYVVVKPWSSKVAGLKDDEYFKVTYTKDGDNYTFAPREEWEIVQLAYQPQTLEVAEKKKRKGQRIEERINASVVLLEAEEGNKGRRIRIDGAIQAGIVNGNGRRYPAPVLESAVAELNSHLNESAGQGRAIQVLGEAEHPSDKGGRPNLLETVIRWEEVTFDGTNVDITGRVLETSKGRDILTLMEGGVMPGVSLRGYGEGKTIREGGEKIFEVSELHITGFDLVLEPSFENVAQLTESQSSMEDDNMNLEELLKLLKEHPEAFAGITEAQIKAMGEAQLKALEEKIRNALGIDENADLAEALKSTAEKARQFEESQKKAAVQKAIAEACKDLPFGEKLNTIFVESFKDMKFETPEQVKAFAESQRKQFSQLAAAGVLKGMGFDEKTRQIRVIGDVLEEETGIPSFARPSFELLESVRKFEMRSKRAVDERAGSPAAVFTQVLLERFDTIYRRQLLAEAQMFEEAEQTSDLNLPYSVSRSIIAEVFPNLVAANVFDVGTIDTSPTRLYYETTTGESGYSASASNEVVTGGEEEVWYDLAHGRITPGTVVVTSNPAAQTYVEGEDYVINYADGKIKFLSAGDIDSNDVLVSYSYTAIRNGEMQPIERVKTTLAYKTIEAAADRLADAISREAIVFSRSQLGWDAVARTMANLIRQMRRKIDQGLLYMAYSAVKSIPNNSTTAWTVSSNDSDLQALYALLGNAAVIVANRYYEPTFYLASLTNTDRLSNWSGFKRGGFPQTLLNAAGFAGMVKNRPIFASTEFPDDLWIVGNRELVQHRVFQPLQIRGPFPVYATTGDTTRLVAAEQYYAEEFNATEALVPEKGAWVPVEDAAS